MGAGKGKNANVPAAMRTRIPREAADLPSSTMRCGVLWADVMVKS